MLDEISAEETREHTKHIGIWRKKTLELSSNPLFWFATVVVMQACRPIEPFQSFLKKKLTEEMLAEAGNHLTRLSSSKASELSEECTYGVAELGSIVDHAPDEFRDCLSEQATSLALYIPAAFHRRIAGVVSEFPHRLAALGQSRPGKDCPLRREIATILLDTPRGEMEINTKKIVDFFNDEFMMARGSGTCGLDCDTGCSGTGVMFCAALASARASTA